jgi:hypothetical protein
MKWAVHVGYMGEMRNAIELFVGKKTGRDHLEDRNR